MKEKCLGIEPREEIVEQTLLYNDKKKRSMHKNIDLSIVVLLDNESTMDLFCDPDLVEDIYKSKGTFEDIE